MIYKPIMQKKPQSFDQGFLNLERERRLELPTPTLARSPRFMPLNDVNYKYMI